MNPDPLASTPFRAIRTLGGGAMGIVYEAEHRVLRTLAVVKVLRPFGVADPAGAADRLRLEAQAAASLHESPYVVRVSDFGHTAAGDPYLVMERLQGRDLSEELAERGPLPAAEAVALARQTLAGLTAAHALGIVHRDIKPANLFLCALPGGGRILKILDFGVAKVLATADARRAPSPVVKPTMEGVAVGTPQYLAPEQALGRPVDCRSDVYAVGAVLYCMLTGRAPFRHHRGPFAVLRAHVLEQPAPPSHLTRQPIPWALEQAVLKALAKDPRQRFQTAEAFSAALAQESCVAATPRPMPLTERIDVSMFRVRDKPKATWVAMPEGDPSADTLRLPGAVSTPRDATAELPVGPADPDDPRSTEHATRAPGATSARKARSRRARRRRLGDVLVAALMLAMVLALLLGIASVVDTEGKRSVVRALPPAPSIPLGGPVVRV